MDPSAIGHPAPDEGHTGPFTQKVTEDSVSLYDKNGERRVAVGKAFTKLDSVGVDLGSASPGRISTGGNQMNPLGGVLPSTIVTPLSTWLPISPEVNMALSSILGVLAVAQHLDKGDSSGNAGGPNYRHRLQFQIVDFGEMLPEGLSNG